MRVVFVIIFLLGLFVQLEAVQSQAVQLETVQPQVIYRLRPGDRVSVSVWQDQKLDREVVIQPDGLISFPLAGHLRAGGQSTQQLESILRSRLQKNYKEKLDVTVMLIRRPQANQRETGPELNVFVTGEVKNPGTFIVTRATTILQALSLAGGLGLYAAKSRIIIQRKQSSDDVLIIPFNYRAAIKGKDPKSNIYLRDGDVVIVPERGLLKGLF